MRWLNWDSLHTEGPWVLGAALFLAAACGYVAGYQTVRIQERRERRRSRLGLQRLYETVLHSLDSALEVCQLLDRFEGRHLTPAQTEHLDRRRSSLLGIIARILCRQKGVEPPPASEALTRPQGPLKVRWTMQPPNSISGLPDRAAFDASLAALLESSRKANRQSHLLLVRLDRLESLSSRYGQAAVHSLLRKLASVVCRSMRDCDLLCHFAPDQLAVLLAGADSETARRLAAAIRDAVRSHRFRIDEDGPEILVTASFGLSVCLVEDRPDLVLDRAADALARSQKLGRNQLHAHDGIGLVHCALSA